MSYSPTPWLLACGSVLALSLPGQAAVVLDADFTTSGVLAGFTDNSDGNKFAEIAGGIQHAGGTQFISYTLIHGPQATPVTFGGAGTTTTVTLEYNGFLNPTGGGELGVGLVYGTSQLWFNRGSGYQILRAGDTATPFTNGQNTSSFTGDVFGTFNSNQPGKIVITVVNDGVSAVADFQVLNGAAVAYSLSGQTLSAANLSGGVVGIKGFMNSTGTVDAHPVYTRLTVDVVPEPASMALAALGGLAMLRRRR